MTIQERYNIYHVDFAIQWNLLVERWLNSEINTPDNPTSAQGFIYKILRDAGSFSWEFIGSGIWNIIRTNDKYVEKIRDLFISIKLMNDYGVPNHTDEIGVAIDSSSSEYRFIAEILNSVFNYVEIPEIEMEDTLPLETSF